MAAGLGFKDFVTGEVLTANDVDGYLMQGTWVFANAAARTSAVTSPQEGNMSYLKDTNSTEYYDGSSWVALGGGASGATFINRTAFSASSAITVDSLFSTTYENYLVSIQLYGSVGNADIQIQGRYGSTTHTGSNYQTVLFGLNYNSATLAQIRNSGAANWTFGKVDTSANTYSTLNFVVYRPSSSSYLGLTGEVVDQYNGTYYAGGANIQSAQNWSGLYITPSSGTFTGQISVYGLAKS
jgi:hypothetical protein